MDRGWNVFGLKPVFGLKSVVSWLKLIDFTQEVAWLVLMNFINKLSKTTGINSYKLKCGLVAGWQSLALEQISVNCRDECVNRRSRWMKNNNNATTITIKTETITITHTTAAGTATKATIKKQQQQQNQ